MALKLAFLVFFSWTVSQFLTYHLAVSFLQQMHEFFTYANVPYVPHFQFSLLLTFIQLLNTFIDYSEKNKRREPVGFLALETLGNMAHNYSMTFLQVSSVFAIKMSQPVANLIVRRILFKKNSSVESTIGFPFIFLGVISFIVEENRIRAKRVGIVLATSSAFISGLLTVFREIFHGDDDTKSSLTLCSMSVWYLWQIACTVAVWLLEMWKVLPDNSTSIAGTFFAFGFFHFVSQHISNFIVVKVLGPLNTLYASLARKTLVLLLLMLTRTQPLTISAVLALVLANSGMLINLLGKIEKLHTSLPNEKKCGLCKKTAKFHRMSKFFFAFTSLALALVLSSQYKVWHQKQIESLAASSRANNRLEFHLSSDMAHFLSLSLADHPDVADARAKTLVENSEMVDEAKRILLNVFGSVLKSTQHVVFLSYAEDVEGAAEKAGAVYLLQRLNKTVHFYCPLPSCTGEGRVGRKFVQNNHRKDISIIVQGGRAFFESPAERDLRELPLKTFLSHPVMFLPLSFNPDMNVSRDAWSTTYASYFNRTQVYMLLSNRYSLDETRKYFKSFHAILAPSAAFGIGTVSHSMLPTHDVLLLRRTDLLATHFKRAFPSVRFHISDWKIGWVQNAAATEAETAALVTQAALLFLQRGKVVLTDKLEAHVMSVLLNIPQVYLEDAKGNVSLQFQSSWTASLKSVIRIGSDDDDRGKHAVKLLRELNN